MNNSLPKLSLVVLVVPGGSGKSMFARRHFLGTEILSSDDCRGMVSDVQPVAHAPLVAISGATTTLP